MVYALDWPDVVAVEKPNRLLGHGSWYVYRVQPEEMGVACLGRAVGSVV
jgi:hypothetical protein